MPLVLTIAAALLLFGGGCFHGHLSGRHGRCGSGGIPGLFSVVLVLCLISRGGLRGL